MWLMLTVGVRCTILETKTVITQLRVKKETEERSGKEV